MTAWLNGYIIGNFVFSVNMQLWAFGLWVAGYGLQAMGCRLVCNQYSVVQRLQRLHRDSEAFVAAPLH
jgi:hypothetical protein